MSECEAGEQLYSIQLCEDVGGVEHAGQLGQQVSYHHTIQVLLTIRDNSLYNQLENHNNKTKKQLYWSYLV